MSRSARKPMRKRRKTAKRAFGLAKKAYKLAKQDIHHLSFSQAPINFGWGLSHSKCLNAPTEGSGESNRSGQAITCMSVHLRGAITYDGQNASTQDFVRMLVVRWEPTDQTAFALSDVLKNAGQTTTPFALYQYITSGQFKVYYDKTFMMTNLNNPVGCIKFNIYRKFNFKTEFAASQSDGDETDIQKNSLMLYVTSNKAYNDATQKYKLQYEGRVTFLP